MKNIYILTAHDGNTNTFCATQHYSNRDAAHGSFEALKQHLLEKYSIPASQVVKWDFNTGGDNRTDILGGRFNVTLNKWSVSKDVSTFIKD